MDRPRYTEWPGYPREAWPAITAFREWAFHLYYDRCYRFCRDRLVRFAKALIASNAPIPKRNVPKIIADWQAGRCHRYRGEHKHASEKALKNIPGDERAE